MAEEFDKNCSSDPTSGCSDGQAGLIAELVISKEKITEKLESIDIKVGNISVEIEECCEETNGNLNDIKDRLDTLISNAAECCDAITDRLDVIAGLLSAPVASGTHVTWTDYVCQQTVE